MLILNNFANNQQDATAVVDIEITVKLIPINNDSDEIQESVEPLDDDSCGEDVII